MRLGRLRAALAEEGPRRAQPLVWLFVRSRGAVRTGAFAVAALVAALAASPELLVVPLTSDRAGVQLVWLSCLPALVAAPLLGTPSALFERSLPRQPLGALRAAWAVALALWPILCHLAVTWSTGRALEWSVWYGRNHLLILTIVMVAALRLPPPASWAPGALYAMVCWIAGTADLVGTPRAWALVHYPPEHPAVAVGVLVAFVAACALHVRCVPASDWTPWDG